MVWSVFDRTSRAYPMHDFLHVPVLANEPAAHRFTYQQARDGVEQLAAQLVAAGFEAGQRPSAALLEARQRG